MRSESLFVGFAVFLCASLAPAVSQIIETVDGIRVIHNSNRDLEARTSGLSLKKIRAIGDIEAEDENVAFYMPLDMGLDGEGNLYVLDTGNHRIQKFSPAGGFLQSLGRRGQGPGEFNFPGSLDIDGEGTLIVASPFINKIQFLSPEGLERGSLMLEENITSTLRVLGPERLISGVRLRPPLPGQEEGGNSAGPVLQILDRQGKVLKKFGHPRDYKNDLVNSYGNEVRFAADGSENIYLAFRFQNRIEKYDRDGVLLWRADRELNFDTEKPLDNGKIQTSGGGISIESPKMNACSGSLAVDGEGRIWILSQNRQLKDDERGGTSIRMSRTGSQSEIAMAPSTNSDITETDAFSVEVYNPEGILLKRFPLDHFSDIIEVAGDTVYILDQIRRMQVHVYLIGE